MENDILIRTMTIEDYDRIKELWMSIHGFGIRSVDDSREGIERFLRRNPATSIVAEKDGEIIGSILCGHDGRTACFYHVCVKEPYRCKGIGKTMAITAMNQLKSEHISKISLVAYRKNVIGNRFWQSVGWIFRDDLNTYDFILDENNQTTFND